MQFQKPATQYVTVAASQTTAPVGVVGCYLESVTIIPATTASGAVTILDGSTAIVSVPAGRHVHTTYVIQLGAKGCSGASSFSPGLCRCLEGVAPV